MTRAGYVQLCCSRPECFGMLVQQAAHFSAVRTFYGGFSRVTGSDFAPVEDVCICILLIFDRLSFDILTFFGQKLRCNCWHCWMCTYTYGYDICSFLI